MADAPEVSLIAVQPPGDDLARLKALVLDSVSSPNSRRAYNKALDDFLSWYRSTVRGTFRKAVVQEYRTKLEADGLAASTINVRLAAIRKLAREAADNGLLAPDLAAGIARVRGPKALGVRAGNWLAKEQAEQLIAAPDLATLKGKRDRVILALLLGCGLRRNEMAGLTFEEVQQRDGRWAIVDSERERRPRAHRPHARVGQGGHRYLGGSHRVVLRQDPVDEAEPRK
jgi:site-specific recombinase XerD